MMKNEHIISILEQQPLNSLSDIQREAIETHVADCSACMNAYQAAAIAAQILQARAAEIIEPTPFFKTRVMAALRAQQAEQVSSFAALWKTARAVVASMVAIVVVLLTLTFYMGNSPSTPNEVSENDSSIYSAESVILDNSNNADDWTDEQVLSTLYESR
jgi:predicted anti-sigma-YlaC factor YlaD